MENKKYTSYSEIDRELEILQLERDIYYKKIVLHFEQSKEVLTSNPVLNLFDTYSNLKSSPFYSIIKFLIPIGINWFINKKRGN